ncbi:hypothetical protein BGZ68_008643 [Mortierella alpina]|nr:hypothetical protein BGZ68_008643 [Mortierella alpina]
MSAFGPSGMFGASNTNNNGASAFGANTGAFNTHSHSNAGFNNNNNPGGGFGAGGYPNNTPKNNHHSTFDASGNAIPRGRGRGSGFRGGRGGGNRGGANMTYVAPGLSSGPPQNQQQYNQPAFTAGSSGDSNSGYSAPAANRGRGGNAGYARGGRGRGGAGGVPGQYKSIQYRPGQNTQSSPAMDTSMSTDDSFHGANGSMGSVFGSSPAPGASTSQQGSAFTAFGPSQGQSQNMGFGLQSSSAFGGNRFEELRDKRVTEREDAIRKGLIPDPNKPVRLEDAITFIGTCKDMCPEFERHEREYQQSVEKFEKIPGTESIDHGRAVKAYSRPAAGADQPLPSDVRPPPILLSTLDYLITDIVTQGDLADSHPFVRDRTRSIRQDFTLQNNRGIEAVQAHEIIARYHILCMHQLCENDNFSAQQEMEQLRKVLTSLQEFYDDLRSEGVRCPNEAEFRAYHILSHLHDPDMMRQAQQLPSHIFTNPYIQVAAEMHTLTRRNNDIRRRAKIQSAASPNFFSRFFKMIAGPATTYLMACLMETSFVDIRKGALKALNKSYLHQHGGFPVEDLVNILGFDDQDECIANCQEYGLELIFDQGRAGVVFGKKDGLTRRRLFDDGKPLMKQHRNERIVEAKRQNYTTAQIIYGDTPAPHQDQAPLTSSRPSGLSNSRVATSSAPQATRLTSSFSRPSMAAGASAMPAASSSLMGPPTVKQSSAFDFGAAKQVSTATGTVPPTAFSIPSTKAGQPANMAPMSSAFAQSPFSSTSQPPSNNVSAHSTLNPAAPAFQPAGASGFTFGIPQPSAAGSAILSSLAATAAAAVAVGSALTSTTSSQPPAFNSTAPQKASASPFTFTAASKTPQPTAPTFSFVPPSAGIAAGGTATSAQPLSFTAGPPASAPVARTPTPVAPLKSDATQIVTKRGKIYPRSTVESIVNQLLEQETNRMIRATAAQMSQEIVVERSVLRAQQRKQLMQQESITIMSDVMNEAMNSIAADIMAELFRESRLMRRVVAHWKEFTRTRIQRAEENRRRREHVLANVRAMGSRAGLGDTDPRASKIRGYNQQQQRIHGAGGNGLTAGKETAGIKAMVMAATNKRKRLLSIGQEGSPDLALVAGLKKVVAPKREMWAPLPVFQIVERRYHGSMEHKTPLQTAVKEPSLMKRRWRLFVNTPSFKETSSKWLLTKLGVDMGRQTKAQQRSGTMVAVHRGSSTDDSAMDVVVHGSEDQSVIDLLGLSKYLIMETAAFMFEFSKFLFADYEVTDEAIRQYWTAERDRLVQFLACFPKVKQPIVFIMWTTSTEIWERISPHMVEYLELDQMVKASQGPLLGYRFLNLNMATMKLDPYIVGSLEWLASETRDFFEDPAILLRNLLDKYRPILNWAFCRISLVEAPFYSQFDEDEEEEANLFLARERKRKQQQQQSGASSGAGQESGLQLQPRNLFVEATESGFNVAVRVFNMELENIAQTIETKGQGETREGAEQEGRVKDAIARFIRQAELPEMKRGSIQSRLNFGMEPRSAFSDFVDVYIASMGGIAKEPQNLEAKAKLRIDVWELLKSSDDRVPMEAIFKLISSQVLTWIEAGILDTKRFSIRLRRWEEQRQELVRQQRQFKAQQQLQDMETLGEKGLNVDAGQDDVVSQEMTVTPVLVHDEVDVEANVFEYEINVQDEVMAWERKVEKQLADRDERAMAVPNEYSSRAGMAVSLSRLGDSRKRRAPENPRTAFKKSRIQPDTSTGSGLPGGSNEDEDENLFMTTKASIPSMKSLNGGGAALSSLSSFSSRPPPASAAFFSQKAESPPPANAAALPLSQQSWLTWNPSPPASLASAAPATPSTPSAASLVGSETSAPMDKLARLRSLLKSVKTTTLQAQQAQ